jgi:hypothetical protein
MDALITYEGQERYCRGLIKQGIARQYCTIQRDGNQGVGWVANVGGFRVYFDSIGQRLWEGTFRVRFNEG